MQNKTLSPPGAGTMHLKRGTVMYNGSYHQKPLDRRARFTIVFSSCLLALLFAAVTAVTLAQGLSFGIFMGEDGLPYVHVAGQVVPQPLYARAHLPEGGLTLVEVTRPSPQIVVDDSGRHALSGNEVYKKVVPSVVGVVTRYGPGSGAVTGTGVILTEDGIIATNHHVVSGAHSVTVVFEDGAEYEADILGEDYYTDIAALKINAKGLTPAELGQSEALEPGDPAYAIGNPLGLDLRNTITDGLISAINRDIVFNDSGADLSMTVIQTSCAVNPGNSGGPLCNQYGQVVGIISSKIMGDMYSSVEGLGFAIPTHIAQSVLNDLIVLGYVAGRPAIGITADTSLILDERTAAYFNLPVGVVVDSVARGTDAEAKGIRKGDIITHVNGTQVKTVAEINKIKNNYKVGDTITLSIYRSGQEFDLEIILTEAK